MSLLRRPWPRPDLILLAILVCGLIIRAGYLVYYRSLPDWDQLSVDNYYHHHWAQSIASGNLFGGTTYFRAPLYIYCLGALYALFGDSLWVGRLLGLAIGLTSVLMTYLLAKSIFDRRTGLIAAALQAVCPVLIYYEGELLLDSFFSLLIQVCIYRVLLWHQQPTRRNVLWVGMSLGLAAIARPTAIALLPVIVLFLFWVLKESSVAFRQLGFLTIGAVLLIGPIFIRNLAVAGDPVVIASQGGINFYIGNNPSADGVSATLPEPLGFNWRIADITAIAEQSEGRDLKPGEVSSYWAGQAWDWIRQNPGHALGLFVRKIFFTFADQEISNNKDLVAVFGRIPFFRYNPLTFAPILGLACVGLFVSGRRSFGAQFVALTVLSMALFNAIFFINGRFRLPAFALLFVVAALGLRAIGGQIIARRWRAAVVLLLGATAVATLSHANLISSRHSTQAQWLNSQMLFYYGNHDDLQALELGRQAQAADATFPEVNLNLGNVWLRQGNTDSAVFYYRREILSNPMRSKAYVNLASIQLLHHELDSSSVLLSRALQLQPRDPTANALAIRVASQRQLSPDSLQRIIDQAVNRSNRELRVLTEAASALLQKDLISEAEPLLLQAVSSQPPAIETDDAAFDRDFIDSPEKFNGRKAPAYYLLGFVHGRNGRFEDAVECSRAALSRDSTLVQAYVNLVSGYLALDSTAKADSVLSKALSKFPQDGNLRRLSLAGERLKRDR